MVIVVVVEGRGPRRNCEGSQVDVDVVAAVLQCHVMCAPQRRRRHRCHSSNNITRQHTYTYDNLWSRPTAEECRGAQASSRHEERFRILPSYFGPFHIYKSLFTA